MCVKCNMSVKPAFDFCLPLFKLAADYFGIAINSSSPFVWMGFL